MVYLRMIILWCLECNGYYGFIKKEKVILLWLLMRGDMGLWGIGMEVKWCRLW